MAKQKRRCVVCRRSDDVCGPLSKRGKCLDCGAQAALRNMQAMHERRGPEYDHWLRRWREGNGQLGRPETEF